MDDSRVSPLLLPVSILTGILLGTCAFLSSKVYNSPLVDRIAVLNIEIQETIGRQVPELELENLDGQAISTHMFHGEEHLLFFGHPNCDGCTIVYPTLQKVAVSKPVLMLIPDGRVEMRTHIKKYGFAFPVVLDTLKASLDALGVRAYPTVALVNSEGLIVKVGSGEVEAERVMRQLLGDFTREQ